MTTPQHDDNEFTPGQIILLTHGSSNPQIQMSVMVQIPFNHQQVANEFVTASRVADRLTSYSHREEYPPPGTLDTAFIEWLISQGYVTPTVSQQVIEWNVGNLGLDTSGGTLRPPGSWRPYTCAECGVGCRPEERVRVYGNRELNIPGVERDLCKPCFQRIGEQNRIRSLS